MSLATINTQALNGVKSLPVSVEVHISTGLPALSIVGLPEAAVRESKDRVRAAIINSGFDFPMQKITVNLAPADLPKDGGRYDLPIAIGILAASSQIPDTDLARFEFHGELALNGDLRAVTGALPVAIGSIELKHTLILPQDSASIAALARDADIYQASHLLEICRFLHGQSELEAPEPVQPQARSQPLDMSDVKGQHRAKRALEIAAAGRHNMLMVGPPGTGKTMLASRLATLLPPLSEQQAIASAAIRSISYQGFDINDWMQRPFRAPHHTASGIALVGGGSIPRPGEISLAHNGVLFLDELTEFSRHTLDVLREPLETGTITISRASRQAEFPANFQLIAAMNPCPQGYNCDGKSLCQCTPDQQRKHRSRISAPLLDRIDIHIEVPAIDRRALMSDSGNNETSEEIICRVNQAYKMQIDRCAKTNAELSSRETETHCQLHPDEVKLLDQAMQKLKLSARAYHRILRMSRTIADLDNSHDIQARHLSEAISYRSLDRFMGG
ncbi:AAA+ ATPase superfamily protein YifB/ComM, associated with DNA recombination [hydrothermal vent metagenome]|uniref:AAA+ ATPase superfamily protein YifB/ComM, associated with DNA recombination n=1 Tax=hydrothermal vent metagenome TaxID=652676 RepID=A0A3B0XIQ3_9ZZZZ